MLPLAGLGLLAILVGASWAVGAARTRSRRTAIASTYRSVGGPVYTFVQFGCAGVLLLMGIGLLSLVALRH